MPQKASKVPGPGKRMVTVSRGSWAPELKSKLTVQGLYPVGTCGVEYVAHLRKTFDEYGRIIREANIRAR